MLSSESFSFSLDVFHVGLKIKNCNLIGKKRIFSAVQHYNFGHQNSGYGFALKLKANISSAHYLSMFAGPGKKICRLPKKKKSLA
jgi:hypothetical protein